MSRHHRSSPVEEALERHDAARPPGYATLPSGVTVEWIEQRDLVEYGGWADDLIAAGLLTEAWLEPTGKHPRDRDGDRLTVTRSWRLRDGEPTRYCKVLRFKPRSAALSLPGAMLAMEARQAFQRWYDRRKALLADLRDEERPLEPIPPRVQHQVEQLLGRFMRGADPDNTSEVRP